MPSGSSSRPAAGGSSSRPAAGVVGASPQSNRGEAACPAHSSELYPGTSLRCPPPPRDPARDPRFPLSGSPGDARCQEAERLRQDDLDREVSLRAELVARQPMVDWDRNSPAPRAPAARDSTTRPSESDWRRGRGDFAHDDHRDDGSHGSRAPAHVRGEDRCLSCEDGHQDDRHSSRADGPTWRWDDPLPGRSSPGHRSIEAPVVPVQANKKKKHKKKKEALVDPGATACPAPTGVPEQATLELPSRVGRPRTREEMMCIKCGCAGQLRSECEAPPGCPMTLVYLGYGTEGGGFYYVDV
ncbi:hypothetical protein ZWY2020_032789 [Hordeum vulgare]|nr:hypothetical protein ZWY2020_032789 [Hordeum vulgare]